MSYTKLIILLIVAFGLGFLGARVVPFASAHKGGQTASDPLKLGVEGSQVVVTATSNRTYLLLGFSRREREGDAMTELSVLAHSESMSFERNGRDRIVAYELVAKPVMYIDLTELNPVGIECTEMYCPVPPWPPTFIEAQMSEVMPGYSPNEKPKVDYTEAIPGVPK